jgi:hypothetical protein
MSNHLKYIVTLSEGSIEEIFVFPNAVNHDCMAESLMRIKNKTHGDWHRVHRTPIAAGFISQDGSCYGESLTLKLTSRNQVDTALFLSLPLDTYLTASKNTQIINQTEVLTIEEAFRLRTLLNKVECRKERNIINNILAGYYDRVENPVAVAKEDLEFIKNGN